MHRKLAFSTVAHDTLGITPLAAGVVTTLRTSAKNSVQKLIDYTTYDHWAYLYTKQYTFLVHDIKLLIPLYDPWLW